MMKRLSKKEIQDLYNAGPEAVGEVINSLIDIINAQQLEIIELKKRVKKLEEQVNKNSRNSSKPPSSDGFNKTKSLRRKSSKPSGGQKGHKGSTLNQVPNPDRIVSHKVSTCDDCNNSLEDVQPTGYKKRQVFDLNIEVVVTEHQVEEKLCSHCGAKNKADFPADVQQPVQYGANFKAVGTYLNQFQLLPLERTCDFFEDIVGIRPSEATIINCNNKIYDTLETIEDRIKELLLNSPVVHYDETGLSVNGKNNWIHSASTAKLTHYEVHQKRGKSAMDDIEILPEYLGVAVHDCWPSYFKFDNCQHALCNAHLLRELIGVYENDERQKWALEMNTLLCEIKDAVNEAKNNDRPSLSPLQIDFYKRGYNQILKSGFELNAQLDKDKYSENAPKKRGRKKQSTAKNLLDRFKEHEDSVLKFMSDFNVPFDNNQAERDVRMVKVKEKISGTFRSELGARIFARIRSYISTARKNSLSVIDAISSAVTGKPYLPDI